ncbi:MAG: inositol monophosphatase family protein [Rickettsiales bacterium]
MSQTSALITVMTAAIRKAAKGVVRDFGEVDKLQISKKGAANFVTNADIRTDQILIAELQKARPKFGFLTEESGIIKGADPKQRFVIDPIDGTTNFIHAIPYISISVAAQKMNDKGEWENVAGIVYDPIHDELFHAEAKHGAYLNGIRIRASTRREDLLLSTSAPRKTRAGFTETLAAYTRVVADDATVRCSGSAALDLAYVAAGRLDGTWYPRLNSWDFVAGSLLVKEANGMITAIDGSPVATDDKASILATNGLIHRKLQALLTAK